MNGDLFPAIDTGKLEVKKTSSRLIAWLQDRLLKMGFWPSVTAVTIATILLSNLVALAITAFFHEPASYVITNAFMATLVPLIVAPPIGGLVLSLVFALDMSRKEIETISRVDALTGVVNRGYFYSLCRAEFSRAARHGLPTSLLMLDIDDFKGINDAYGHDAGDAVLVAFAKHCLRHLRSEDVFARTGGEEFAVLLPMTNLAEAALVAEKLRRTVERLDVVVSAHTVNATVSIGAAELMAADSVESVIKRADQNLYAAKAAGRNTVVAN